MSLFEAVLSTSEMRGVFSERSVVDAMLRFEAALARAQARLGLIPGRGRRSRSSGSCKVELFDVAKIVRDSGRAGSVADPAGPEPARRRSASSTPTRCPSCISAAPART